MMDPESEEDLSFVGIWVISDVWGGFENLSLCAGVLLFVKFVLELTICLERLAKFFYLCW
jgi:hypothetical protein